MGTILPFNAMQPLRQGMEEPHLALELVGAYCGGVMDTTERVHLFVDNSVSLYRKVGEKLFVFLFILCPL